MMPIRQRWYDFMGIGLKTGVYKFDGKEELSGHRYHLRIDPKSRGVLIIDASKLIFLNGTAVDYVRSYLERLSDRQVFRYMNRRYKGISRQKIISDYSKVKSQLIEVVKGNLNVVQFFGPETFTAGADDLPAPYRMDLALTYRCQNDCGHCYNETKVKKELSIDEWKEIIERLWGLGIPHIVFTGGEPTLFQGLDELVEKSEEMGQITGLITNGRSLSKEGYLKNLVKIGLDHVQITVLSHKESIHDSLAGDNDAWKETIEGLKTALKEDLYVSTNTTIMKSNYADIEETLRFLISFGVKNVAFNSIIRSGKGEEAEGITCEELSSALVRLKKIADESGTNIIWYSPTPYCEFNPIVNGFGIKQCTACSINMAIEPDGTVIPCQSYYEPLGNILSDQWESIWNHKLCKDIRERKYLDEKCVSCELVQVCGGGCPLSREHGDYLCLDRHSSI